jgi:hypothetical protein
MRKRKSKSGLGEMILLGFGMYGLYKMLEDNEPVVGQAIVPNYNPTTGTESEEAKKNRIQKTMEAARVYGIDTYGWEEGKKGEGGKMDCLNFVYNVLRDAGYRDESGNEIPRTRTNNMHKQTAFFDIVDMYVPYIQKQLLVFASITKKIQVGDIVVFTQFKVKKGLDTLSAQFPDDYVIGPGHAVLIRSFETNIGFLTYEMPYDIGPKTLTLKNTIDIYNDKIKKRNDVIQVHAFRPNRRLIAGYYLNEKKKASQYLQGEIV